MGSAYNQSRMCAKFDYRRLYIGFSSVRAGDIMNGYGVLLITTTAARGEGRAPEMPVSKSAKFKNELENIFFVGYTALPTELPGTWLRD